MTNLSALSKRTLVVLHRWLGAALCVMLSVWFLSGIVLMYWSYPTVSMQDRLQHASALNPARIRVSAAEAFARQDGQRPRYVLLATFDGRPVYVGDNRMIYADDGREAGIVDDGMVDRAAVDWARRPLSEATKESVQEIDQWTLAGGLRTLRPLYKYSWPDGQQVYVDGSTADVVQYTTTAARFWAYLGAIPHWLYFPALRTRDAGWSSFMVWTSLAVTVMALMGIAVASWMYSPRKRYRHAGGRARIPYRGWKRWHMVLGLAFGAVTTTWAFSGLLSLEPFRLEERLTALTDPAAVTADEQSVAAWARMSKMLLSDALELSIYAAKPPAAAIASIPGFEAKELEFTSFDGEPMYLVTDGRGDTRIVPVRGGPRDTFGAHSLVRRLRAAAGPQLAELRVIDRYDAYYRDRRGRLPLPVIYARMNDAAATRYYIDPKTASVVASYSAGEWVSRWLQHGLHSLDFPWLYNHRPLWDIVVVTLMLGGTALCATSLVMAWRVIAWRAARLISRLNPPPEIPGIFADCEPRVPSPEPRLRGD